MASPLTGYMTLDKLFRTVQAGFFYFLLSLNKYLLSSTVVGWERDREKGSILALPELSSSRTALHSAKRMD